MAEDFPSFSLQEAASLRGRFVYAFRDDADIFYVGKTTNPGMRFKDASKSYSKNIHLLKRLRESSGQVRVLVLDRGPENLEAAEEAAITKYASTLVNKVLNPFRADSGPGLLSAYIAPLCVNCRIEIKVKKSKYCRKCLGALLGLTPGKSKQQLRDELEQIRLRGMGAKSQGSTT